MARPAVSLKGLLGLQRWLSGKRHLKPTVRTSTGLTNWKRTLNPSYPHLHTGTTAHTTQTTHTHTNTGLKWKAFCASFSRKWNFHKQLPHLTLSGLPSGSISCVLDTEQKTSNIWKKKKVPRGGYVGTTATNSIGGRLHLFLLFDSLQNFIWWQRHPQGEGYGFKQVTQRQCRGTQELPMVGGGSKQTCSHLSVSSRTLGWV